MNERIEEIPTADGRVPTFITHPEEGGPFTGVILYMDVWGVREELFDIARRVATVGYYCMVPDLYYRQGTVRTQFRDAQGRMVSFHRLTASQQAQAAAPLHKLSDAMVVRDTAALLEFARGGEPVLAGPMGCIGYCMGGRHAFAAAAEHSDHLQAIVSLHGTLLMSDRPDSPHRRAQSLRGEVYCGYAEHDDHAPPAMIRDLAALLARTPVRYRHEIHAGAEHGYALPDRDIHDKRAANRDWEIIFPMLRRLHERNASQREQP